MTGILWFPVSSMGGSYKLIVIWELQKEEGEEEEEKDMKKKKY